VAIEGVEWHLQGVGRLPAGPAEMLVRPEAIRFGTSEPGALPVTVTGSRFVGPGALFSVATEAGVPLEIMAPTRSVELGARAAILPSRRAGGGIHLYPVDGA
jgi:hypothetical protein